MNTLFMLFRKLIEAKLEHNHLPLPNDSVEGARLGVILGIVVVIMLQTIPNITHSLAPSTLSFGNGRWLCSSLASINICSGL